MARMIVNDDLLYYSCLCFIDISPATQEKVFCPDDRHAISMSSQRQLMLATTSPATPTDTIYSPCTINYRQKD